MTDATSWETFDQVGFALDRMMLGVLWQSSILFAAVTGLTWLLRRRAGQEPIWNWQENLS